MKTVTSLLFKDFPFDVYLKASSSIYPQKMQ